jgi:hypothetical protein
LCTAFRYTSSTTTKGRSANYSRRRSNQTLGEPPANPERLPVRLHPNRTFIDRAILSSQPKSYSDLCWRFNRTASQTYQPGIGGPDPRVSPSASSKRKPSRRMSPVRSRVQPATPPREPATDEMPLQPPERSPLRQYSPCYRRPEKSTEP